jgi:hypothetical protein
MKIPCTRASRERSGVIGFHVMLMTLTIMIKNGVIGGSSDHIYGVRMNCGPDTRLEQAGTR